MSVDLQVNCERLWQSHQDIAAIGALPNGGCCRLALSQEDQQARALFITWCKEAGCEISFDQAGNIFARRPGTESDLPAVATGSHLDTQPHAGNFDGIYGVLAGLEVFRTLNDAGIATRASLETIVWTNEESVRFQPPCSGSLVFTGGMGAAALHAEITSDGSTVGADLVRSGHLGPARDIASHPLACFIEAHIEQGPILEQERLTIGAVTGIQGARIYSVVVQGRDGHASTVPMQIRCDALVGASEMVLWLNRMGREFDPDARITVGHFEVFPNSDSTIPGRVVFDIQARHPQEAALQQIDQMLREELTKIAQRSGLRVGITQSLAMSPISFDQGLIEMVERTAARLGYPNRRIVSGAGHDSGYLADVTPTAMIFVPCEGGVSHNEAERADPKDLAAGADVLLQVMLEKATAA